MQLSTSVSVYRGSHLDAAHRVYDETPIETISITRTEQKF